MDQSDEWVGRIETLSGDGEGVGIITIEEGGHSFRRPIFVPYTAPGDLVAANILGARGKYLFGSISRIVEPSPLRVMPSCPHFMTCGGCNLEHLSYEEQLIQKKNSVLYLLQRKNILLPNEIRIIPAIKQHHYRRRSRVAVRFSDKKILAGFRKWRSREIVPITSCFIVDKRILEFIALLQKSEAPFDLEEIEITVVVGDAGKIGLLIPLDDLSAQHRMLLREFFSRLYANNRKLIGNMFVSEERVVKTIGQVQEHLTYQIDGFVMHFSPENFIQANVETNNTLVKEAMAMLFSSKAHRTIDLYAGIGNLSLPSSRHSGHVIAVEGFEASVLMCRLNALSNGVKNLGVIHRSTERYMREYLAHRKAGTAHPEYPVADALILDPPRLGLGERTANMVAQSGIAKVLYVSCDPQSLANDLAILQSTYVVRQVLCIDMFPDISHVETLVFLEKKEE